MVISRQFLINFWHERLTLNEENQLKLFRNQWVAVDPTILCKKCSCAHLCFGSNCYKKNNIVNTWMKKGNVIPVKASANIFLFLRQMFPGCAFFNWFLGDGNGGQWGAGRSLKFVSSRSSWGECFCRRSAMASACRSNFPIEGRTLYQWAIAAQSGLCEVDYVAA